MAVEFFYDKVSTTESAGRGDRTRSRMHAKRIRFQSSYRARLGKCGNTSHVDSKVKTGNHMLFIFSDFLLIWVMQYQQYITLATRQNGTINIVYVRGRKVDSV